MSSGILKMAGIGMIKCNSDQAVVIVHPHFAPDILQDIAFLPNLRNDVDSPIRKYLLDIAGNSEEAKIIVSRNEILHRFYRRQIDRIAKEPGSLLLILQKVHDWQSDCDHELDWTYKKEITGLTGNGLKKFSKSLYRLQERLIEYAKNKLGSRVLISASDPEDIASEVENFFDTSMRISIYGEALGCCVEEAYGVIAPIRQAKIEISKCAT